MFLQSRLPAAHSAKILRALWLAKFSRLPGKAFVILRARPGILGFLKRLSPFVRFLRLRNLIKHLIVSGAVIASAKDTRDQDKANKERTGHKIFDPHIVQMQRKQEMIIYRVPAGKAARRTTAFHE
jgi:hypothetical protein